MEKRYTHVSESEREEISRCLALDMGCRAIAQRLLRSPSTISREIARNAASLSRYRATEAQGRSRLRASAPRRPRRLTDPWLADYVLAGLQAGWSPQQMAARLKRDYPADMAKRISHETIYAAMYIIPRGELRRQLLACLRQPRQARRPRSRGADRRGHIPNMTPIAQRPPEVETRAVPGHWEGDLIKGARNASAVGTLVERTTRLVVLARMPGADARSARLGFTRKLKRIPTPLRKSLTYDQGKEMAQHERLSRKLSLNIYFADPHSPWQRGSNENTNGLLRQYLPKGSDLSAWSQRQLNAIAEHLNNRPRKTLKWMTPNEAWAHQLQSLTVALGT